MCGVGKLTGWTESEFYKKVVWDRFSVNEDTSVNGFDCNPCHCNNRVYVFVFYHFKISNYKSICTVPWFF